MSDRFRNLQPFFQLSRCVYVLHCLHPACGYVCLFLGAAGCALPQTRTTARQSGCVRVAAAALPNGFTRPACSAGWTRSSGATARHVWPAHSAMQNTSSSFQNWVGVFSQRIKVGLEKWPGGLEIARQVWRRNSVSCMFYFRAKMLHY